MDYYIYILANNTRTVLYTGVTNNLLRRVYEHKNQLASNSFTARYNVHNLVYFEQVSDPAVAIAREKQIKSWNRKRKNKLVERKNPKWEDLYPSILP